MSTVRSIPGTMVFSWPTLWVGLLLIVLLSPAYRGRVCRSGPEQARVRVNFDLTDYNVELSQLRLNAQLRRRRIVQHWPGDESHDIKRCVVNLDFTAQSDHGSDRDR